MAYDDQPNGCPKPQTRRPGGSRCLWNTCERGQKTWLKAGRERLPQTPRPALQKTRTGKAALPPGPRAQLQQAASPWGEAQTAQACWTRPVLPRQQELALREGWEPGRGLDVAPPARRSPAPQWDCTCGRACWQSRQSEVVRTVALKDEDESSLSPPGKDPAGWWPRPARKCSPGPSLADPGPDSSRNCEKSSTSSESHLPVARYGSPGQQDRSVRVWLAQTDPVTLTGLSRSPRSDPALPAQPAGPECLTAAAAWGPLTAPRAPLGTLHAWQASPNPWASEGTAEHVGGRRRCRCLEPWPQRHT